DGLDSVLTAFDSAGRSLSTNDDAGDGTKDSLVRLNVVAGRTYYLQAATFRTKLGAYLLTLSTGDPFQDDFGDTLADADSLTLGPDGTVAVAGAIQLTDDVDVFRIVPPADGGLTVVQTA